MEEFFYDLASNYSDILSVIAIPFIIGIFAFAFPLLFDIASRIDDKYESSLLIKVFRKDWKCKCFLGTLICALICCAIWMIQIPRLKCLNFGNSINAIVDNSALILLTLSAIALILSTIGVVKLAYTYYVPEKLLSRLIKQYRSCSKNPEKEVYFEAISKILFFSIKKEGEPLARQLYDFYWEEFITYRKDKENQIVDYPQYFYNVLFDANERLCHRERKSISLYNNSFYPLFIDEFQHTTISENTFSFLWRCLSQSIFYKKNEYVISYWEKAHQYMNLWLNIIPPKYDSGKITNQEDIDKRNAEREQFIEFHYSLGGFLMMRGEYTLLNQLIGLTNQKPPKYVLVPESMQDVINRFMKIEKGYGYESICYYEQRYPFIDVSGVDAEEIIKRWIKRYFAILFIRQYTLTEHYTYQNILMMPPPPNSLIEKRRWNEELDVLKNYVNEYLEKKDILKFFGMEYLFNKEWFKQNGKIAPNDLIENLKCDIYISSVEQKRNQEIDQDKKKQSQEESKAIINKAFEEVATVFSQDKILTDVSLHFYGRYEVLDKAAFAKESDVSYINTDSIVSQCISDEFKINSMNIFFKMQQTLFVLEEKDLFKAIDNLNIISKSDYVILNIGLYLEYYKDFHKISKLEFRNNLWTYDNINILEAPYNPYLSQSLIVIRKEQLPSISHNQISDEIISKYQLTEIDDKKHIYFSLIDLNKETEIINEVKKETNIQDLEMKVLCCIDMDAEIGCHSQAKFIRLKAFSPFEKQGNPNKIEDVITVWKSEEEK